jgi:hypothetical protein
MYGRYKSRPIGTRPGSKRAGPWAVILGLAGNAFAGGQPFWVWNIIKGCTCSYAETEEKNGLKRGVGCKMDPKRELFAISLIFLREPLAFFAKI